GQDGQARPGRIVVELVLELERGTRPDQAHLPTQYVEQLGDLVEAQPAQQTSDQGDTGVANDLENGAFLSGNRVAFHGERLILLDVLLQKGAMRAVVVVVIHGAELV